ncbi:MAG: tRNA (guanosine(46)-N7)-methyltransferase TrmB [Bacteroidota bacterium]
MPKDKLRRFAEYSSFPNTYDFNYDLKGKWRERVFNNNNPLVLELGCGKGEYTVALAREFPDKNFIGIDIKSNRMWKGAGIALQEKLTNAAFLRLVMHKITEVVAPHEADEIWITFPDPFPKLRHAKHRLTHPRFLNLYRQILKLGGVVNFKTDDTDLFEFTVDMLPRIGITPITVDRDVHSNTNASPYLKNIRTHYENLFMAKGRTIKYTCFTLDKYDETKATQFVKQLDELRKQQALSENKGNE